jgi:NitT/TauT family transport system substrate-binding protein
MKQRWGHSATDQSTAREGDDTMHTTSFNLGKVTAVALAAVLLGFSAQPTRALEKVPFTLSWKLMGSFAPIFLAVDRGYFAAGGIELDIVSGDGSANVVKRLASGAYQIGVGDIASVIRFNALNPDSRVKALYNQTPADLAFVTLKDRKISKPADLKGRVIGAPVGDTAYKMFPAFSKATGVMASDLKWEHMTFSIREAMLIQGKVDAVTANEGTAYFNLQGAGISDANMVFLRYSDYGVNLVNIGLMANESFIKAKPDLVKKIVHGFHRGFMDAIVDPKAAIASLLKRDPLLDANLERARLQYAIDRMVGQPDAKAAGLGFYTDASVTSSIDIVTAAENLSVKIGVGDLIDMSFLPPAAERAIPAAKTN